MLDQSSVTVYNRSRSFMFSNDRLFNLNLTFPDVSQYPHIFYIFYEILLNKSTDLSCISSRAATILRLLRNKTIQLSTQVKKSEPGL